MGRAPCCDRSSVKKGPWSPEEDAKLKAYIEQNGTGGNWIALPQKIGLKRCGKSCRLRWLNYLRPNVKHGGFSEEEDRIICSLYISIGSRWSIIAAQLPGRTDNDIKNYWNTRLKKKLFGKQRQKQGSSKGKEMTSMVSDNNNNQNPYWPDLPVLQPIPYSDYEPRLNGASIRKLLIKLGGKFSEDDQPISGEQDPQYPMNNSIISMHSIYENPINLISSPLDVLNAQYNMNHGTALTTSPLQGNFTAEQNLDWEATNPFVIPLPPIAASNDERLPGIILQEGALDDFRYPIEQ